MLTRPKKVPITSETLREDVAKRLQQAGLVLGKAVFVSGEGHARSDGSRRVRARKSRLKRKASCASIISWEKLSGWHQGPLPMKAWQHNSAMIAGS